MIIVATLMFPMATVTPNLPGTGGNNSGNNGGNSKPPIVIIVSPKPNPRRPNIPSKQRIECTYFEENLTFAFEYPEGVCKLNVLDVETGLSTMYQFDSVNPNTPIHIGDINQAILEILTENGKIYEGFLCKLQYIRQLNTNQSTAL